MQRLPYEVIDMILSCGKEWVLAVQLKREYVAKQVYDSYVRGRADKLWMINEAMEDIEIVKWLNKPDNELTRESMRAVELGYYNIVKYLHENRSEWFTTYAMDIASSNGNLQIVKFLHEYRKEGCTKNAMDMASERGHMAVVKYLHEKRSEGCTTDAMDMASAYGHLDVVTYLQENRWEGCTRHAMDLASAYGHLDVVKYLQENRCKA
jgi:hypothetical protein